jgi:hypothetical protein
MKSEFLSMFGIPPTECEIEVRKDDLGVPRLWFRSTGNLPVGLDLTGATQLPHLLTDAGEAKQANEIGQLITKAHHLSVNGL